MATNRGCLPEGRVYYKMEVVSETEDAAVGFCCAGWEVGGQKDAKGRTEEEEVVVVVVFDEDEEDAEEEEEEEEAVGQAVGQDRSSWGVDLDRCVWLHAGSKGPRAPSAGCWTTAGLGER